MEGHCIEESKRYKDIVFDLVPVGELSNAKWKEM
jgi:hypothetical protein